MKPISYGGVSFYPEAVVAMTEAEFVAHEGHHGLTKAQLKEAYKLCQAAVKVAKPEPSA